MNTAFDQANTRSQSPMLGKYRLVARLGSGGMAEVFLAVAQNTMNVNRLVVVKRLRDEQAEDPEARTMFLNEARLAAHLSHPNIVQTFEADTQGGSWFFAMEYVEGQPLSRVLAKLRAEGQAMEPVLAARVAADALAALDYAHDAVDFDGTPLEIVHRDVSPQNIMLTYGGTVKLVDFGIAKAVGTTQTAHGVFKGKVAFMAPEQVLGDNIDRRVDIFAAGIVLWEAVCGKPLLAAQTPAKTLHNVMNMVIPRASTVRPGVPERLDVIIARALERDVALRYPTARAMRDDLEAFLASVGGASNDHVGTLVQALFAERRQTVQKQVKAQIAALSFNRIGEEVEEEDVLSRTQMRAASAVLVDLSDAAGPNGDMLSHASIFRVVTDRSAIGVAPRPKSAMALVAVVLGLAATAIAMSTILFVRRAPVTTQTTVNAAETAASRDGTGAATTTTTASSPIGQTTATEAAQPADPPPPPTMKAQAPAAPQRAPAPVWRPASPPATTSSPPAPAAEAPRPSSTPSAIPKPAETSTGRTFRRSL